MMRLNQLSIPKNKLNLVRLFHVFCLISLSISPLKAQNDSTINSFTSRHNTYFEILGKGGGYSFNYEYNFLRRDLIATSIHIGFNVGPPNFLKRPIVPVILCALIGRKKTRLEFGFGASFVWNSNPTSGTKEAFFEAHPINTADYIPSVAVNYILNVGVRFDTKKRWFYRLNFYPHYLYPYSSFKRNWIPWFGASFGIKL